MSGRVGGVIMSGGEGGVIMFASVGNDVFVVDTDGLRLDFFFSVPDDVRFDFFLSLGTAGISVPYFLHCVGVSSSVSSSTVSSLTE